MLDQNLQQQLTVLLGQIPGRVELQLTLDNGNESSELENLATDLARLSDKVRVLPEPGIAQRRPTLDILSPERGTRISFAGVPSGHEFTSLVLALLHSGGHPPKLEPEMQQQIRNLPGDYNFEVYVSLSCQTCPDVVQALNTLAASNPGIRTTMIDGALFPQEIQAHNILAVPTVYLNGKRFSQGRIGVADILRKLDQSVDSAGKAALGSKAPYDMLIVGGGPAGASAAIYAARKGLRTGVGKRSAARRDQVRGSQGRSMETFFW